MASAVAARRIPAAMRLRVVLEAAGADWAGALAAAGATEGAEAALEDVGELILVVASALDLTGVVVTTGAGTAAAAGAVLREEATGDVPAVDNLLVAVGVVAADPVGLRLVAMVEDGTGEAVVELVAAGRVYDVRATGLGVPFTSSLFISAASEVTKGCSVFDS